MAARKELKEISRAAEKQGWTVKTRKSGHLTFYAPDGINMVTTGGTPSDHKAIDNLLSYLRRYGFEWKGR
jgi:hypothetical protein